VAGRILRHWMCCVLPAPAFIRASTFQTMMKYASRKETLAKFTVVANSIFIGGLGEKVTIRLSQVLSLSMFFSVFIVKKLKVSCVT
jgi:hypothetical protein